MKESCYLFFFLLLVSCGLKGPTDDQLKKLSQDAGFAVQAAQEEGAKDKAFQDVVEKSVEEFDIQKITPEQVKLLFETAGIVLDNRLRQWLVPVLDAQAKREGMAGVEASYLRWIYFPRYGEQIEALSEAEACKAFLKNPGIGKFLEENHYALIEVVNKIAGLKGDKWVEYGIVEDVSPILDLKLPEEAVLASVGVFNMAFGTDGIPDSEKDKIRQKVLAQYIALRGRGGITDSKKMRRIESTCNYLQGPFAMNTLEGNKAPELDFLWTSRGQEKKLSDLKGKVVMLDFWATKCGACVAIFPNVKALAEYYAGYPVEILGVTSLQGYHVDIKNSKNHQTSGRPELEFDLMRDFMKDMDMTWKVVFTEQSAMNPEYGALGIPHITLIDAEGKVRYNGVDPEELPYLKAEKINALLKEAGLPCPSKPMEQKDYRKTK